jgi:magnesium chelatase family protein
MLAKLFSYTLVGIDAAPVEVEVDVSSASMPKTVLVGLAEVAVKESTHRVERALVNSGYQRPADRVVINLAPAGSLCEQVQLCSTKPPLRRAAGT